MSVRIGLGQMRVEGGQRERNLKRASLLIERAKSEGCSAIILPECLDLGWTDPSARTLAEPIPGPISQFLQNRAKDCRIEVVAGLTERAGEFLFNTSIWISENGDILGRHRKINILDIARDLYSRGRELSVFSSTIGQVGMTICADNFPESLSLSRSLALMGAKVIASPCAWAVDANHDQSKEPYGDLWLNAYRELTQEFEVTILGVSNVGWISEGPWEGRKCIGCSLAVGPGGQVLVQGPYGVEAETLIVLDVESPRSTFG